MSCILLGVGPSGPEGVDLSGCVSGKLTIFSLYGKKYFQNRGQTFMWLADCACGNTDVLVDGQHFLRGHVKSCGCVGKESSAGRLKRNSLKRKYRKDQIPPDPINLTPAQVQERKKKYKDLLGKRVGSLTILRLEGGVVYFPHCKSLGKPRSNIVTSWMCQCDCGNRALRTSNYLARRITHCCDKCARAKARPSPVLIGSL